MFILQVHNFLRRFLETITVFILTVSKANSMILKNKQKKKPALIQPQYAVNMWCQLKVVRSHDSPFSSVLVSTSYWLQQTAIL